MAVPKWTFVLTDLLGNSLGEVNNATGAKVTLPLNATPTASFQVPIQHPLASYFSNPNWDGLLKAYRNNVLRFIGPVLSGAEQFDEQNGQTVAVNAAGAAWRLGFRLLGTGQAGWSYGTAVTTYDLGFIAQQMILAANAVAYTGIDLGTLSASSAGSAGTYWFKPVDQAITEISTGLNSFDYEVAPIEPTASGFAFPRIGLFNAANLIGTTKSNAIFEYGTSKANVASYGRQTDRSNLATYGYMEDPSASNHTNIQTYVDPTAETARGRYEALIDNGNVQWVAFRQQLLQENINIRKQARQVVTFEPVMNASPAPFDDYIVGDVIRARINVNGVNELDANLRVWGITFDIDKGGNEQVALTLIA